MKRLPKSKYKFIEICTALALAFLGTAVSYSGAKLIIGSLEHHDITSAFDKLIPFVPWTVIIYFGCYLFWGVNYYLCANHDEDGRDRLFAADILGKLVCMVIYIAWPTTNIRPEVATDGNLWDFLMRFLYWIDSPENLFPSIHCFVSWLCWIAVRKRKDIHWSYRWFSLAMAVAVCVSTLTTKQHVMIDVAGGIALAELSYALTGIKHLRSWFSVVVNKITGIFVKEKEPCEMK